jgi:hypothetical protein
MMALYKKPKQVAEVENKQASYAGLLLYFTKRLFRTGGPQPNFLIFMYI